MSSQYLNIMPALRRSVERIRPGPRIRAAFDNAPQALIVTAAALITYS